MAIHKVTFMYEGVSRGWQEAYWFNSVSGSHDLTMHEAIQLAHKRKELLGQECFIKAIRVATDGGEHEGFLHEEVFRPSGEQNDAGLPIGEPAAMADVALLVRLQNLERTKTKIVYVRGVWDKISSRHGEYVGALLKDWQDVVHAWRLRLIHRNWGWMSATAPVKKAITNIAQAENGVITFTFAADMFLGVAVDTMKSVRISGINNGHSILNAVHVLRVTGNTTAVSTQPLAMGPTNIGGFGRYGSKTFLPFWHLDDARIVTRECGAPLLESPGRQKKRPRA